MRRALEWALHGTAGACLAIWMAYIPSHSATSGLEVMLAGTAARPFVYRVLAPMLIRGWNGLTGQGEFIAELVVFMLSAIILSKATLELARALGRGWMAWSLIMPGWWIISLTFKHVYDLTTWAVWAVALLCLYRRQWLRFTLAYGLACLSKETAVLLIPVAGLWMWDYWPRPRLAAVLAMLCLEWGGLRAAVMWLYRDNPGSIVEWHLADQVQMIPAILFVVAVLIGIVILTWPHQPKFLYCVLALFPVLLGMHLVWGYPGEIRVFGEIYPALALLLINTPAFFLRPAWRPNETPLIPSL